MVLIMPLAAPASARVMSVVHAAAATTADETKGRPLAPRHAVFTSPPDVPSPTHRNHPR
jgi:hypothetical protein